MTASAVLKEKGRRLRISVAEAASELDAVFEAVTNWTLRKIKETKMADFCVM